MLSVFWDRQLCFYVKKLFVSEKTQKSELCHFSQEIYVITFCPGRGCSRSKSEKVDDVNLPRKMTKFTFLCFFTNKYFFHIKTKLTVSKSLSSMWRYFFDSMHFRLCLAPSGGFLKKEPRQFWFHLTRVK